MRKILIYREINDPKRSFLVQTVGTDILALHNDDKSRTDAPDRMPPIFLTLSMNAN